MAETDEARSSIERSRERIGEIAEELTRRVSPDHLKRRAKEATVRKTQEWKERVVASPTALGLLGGLCGAIAGSLLGKSTRARNLDTQWSGDYVASSELRPTGRISVERYDVSTPSIYETSIGAAGDVQTSGAYGQYGQFGDEGHSSKLGAAKEKAADAVEGIKEKVGGAIGDVRSKAGDAMHGVRDRVSHARHGVQDRMSDARERIPSRYTMQHQASNWAHEQPLVLGIGALALGALVGSLIPVSRAEQKALTSVKGQLDEKIASAKGQIHDKLSSVSTTVSTLVGDKLGSLDSSSSQQVSATGSIREDGIGSENEGSRSTLSSDDDLSPPIH